MTAVTKGLQLNIPPHELREGYVQGQFSYVHCKATSWEKSLLLSLVDGMDADKCNAKIRCFNYSEGSSPCYNMEWHTDVGDIHRIWVSSCPPEFKDFGRLEASTIYEYGEVEHRAKPIEEAGLRMFARVSYVPKQRIGNRMELR